MTVSRLDFLLSGFALHRVKGGWLDLSNALAYVSATAPDPPTLVVDVPAGIYDRLRVHVGLPPELNAADPAAFPAEHPLNPNVNGLHWSWQGGYVFLAFEGLWCDAASAGTRGYSFHLATDRQLATVECPVTIRVPSLAGVALVLDPARLLDGPQPIRLTEAAASTHSRDDDELADQLRRNVEAAFEARVTRPQPKLSRAGVVDDQPAAAPVGTPYRFTFAGTFPIPALPRDNPLTDEGVALGRALFHDPLLSVNAQQSCAGCHAEPAGFADPGKALSLGAEGRPGKRNAMSLANLAWKRSFFWDGRAPSLREQVFVPITDVDEMHETTTNVAAKLDATTNYPPLFRRAFGSPAITPARIGLALEQFMLTQIAGDSKFDRALRKETELTAEEKRGFDLFSTEFDPRRSQFGADCFHCHGNALFTNHGFANNGLDATFADTGRFRVTSNETDRGQFAVPTLRNVALTAPYMHDGRFATLDEVVTHYNSGIVRSATLDPNLAKHPDAGLQLSQADQQALVAFLKTLTEVRLVP